MDHPKCTKHIWIPLAESFPIVVLELSYIALMVLGGIIFACVHTGGPIEL